MRSRPLLLLDVQPIAHRGIKDLVASSGWSEALSCFHVSEAARLEAEGAFEMAIVDPPAWNDELENLLRTWKARELPVVFYSMREEVERVQAALRHGVRGYVSKRDPETELTKAMQEAVAGLWYASPRISRTLLEGIACPQPQIGFAKRALSVREQEVFSLAAEALSAREIARKLGVSAKTVESHVSRIKEKLNVGSWRDLQRMAAAQTRVFSEV